LNIVRLLFNDQKKVLKTMDVIIKSSIMFEEQIQRLKRNQHGEVTAKLMIGKRKKRKNLPSLVTRLNQMMPRIIKI